MLRLNISSILIQIIETVTVPINDNFNNDFNNSTMARIEKIRLIPLIGSIFSKSNFNGSVVNKKPNCK